MKNFKKYIVILLSAAMLAAILSGCAVFPTGDTDVFGTESGSVSVTGVPVSTENLTDSATEAPDGQSTDNGESYAPESTSTALSTDGSNANETETAPEEGGNTDAPGATDQNSAATETDIVSSSSVTSAPTPTSAPVPPVNDDSSDEEAPSTPTPTVKPTSIPITTPGGNTSATVRPNITPTPKPTATPTPTPVPTPKPTQRPELSDVDKYYIRNNGLDEKQKELYDLIYAGALDFKTEIDVSSFGMSYSNSTEMQESVAGMLLAFFGDHPEIFWYTGSFSYSYNANYSPQKITLGLAYDKAEAQAMQSKIDAEVEKVLAGAEGMSEYECSEYFYKYVIQNTAYQEGDNAHNMYGVFIDGQAVCEGYAKAYQYLMNKAGIVTIYICGKATGTDGTQTSHGWNIAKINGNWYHTDCTWGDPTVLGISAEEQKTNVDYAYLNVTSDDLSSTHVIGNQIFTVPSCTATEDNFYVKKGLYFTSFDKTAVDNAVKAKLQSMNGSKETKLYIKFKNHADAATAKEYLTNKDSGSSHFFDLTAGLDNFVKKYTVNSVRAGCFCFTLAYS